MLSVPVAHISDLCIGRDRSRAQDYLATFREISAILRECGGMLLIVGDILYCRATPEDVRCLRDLLAVIETEVILVLGPADGILAELTFPRTIVISRPGVYTCRGHKFSYGVSGDILIWYGESAPPPGYRVGLGGGRVEYKVSGGLGYPGSPFCVGMYTSPRMIIWDLMRGDCRTVSLQPRGGYVVIQVEDMASDRGRISEAVASGSRGIVRCRDSDVSWVREIAGSLRVCVDRAATYDVNEYGIRALQTILSRTSLPQSSISEIVDLHRARLIPHSTHKWSIRRIGYGYLYGYGGDNVLTFERGLIGIIGENGAGKTSIIYILIFGLYGVTLRGDRDAMLRNGSSRGSVTVEFVVDDVEYRITRTVERSRVSAAMMRRDDEWTTILTATDDIDRRVHELIGSMRSLLTTGVYASGEDDILRARGSERMKILTELIGVCDSAAIAKDVKRDLTGLNAELTGLIKPSIPDPEICVERLRTEHVAMCADRARKMDELAEQDTQLQRLHEAAAIPRVDMLRSKPDVMLAELEAAMMAAQSDMYVAEGRCAVSTQQLRDLRAEIGTDGDIIEYLTGILERYAGCDDHGVLGDIEAEIARISPDIVDVRYIADPTEELMRVRGIIARVEILRGQIGWLQCNADCASCGANHEEYTRQLTSISSESYDTLKSRESELLRASRAHAEYREAERLRVYRDRLCRQAELLRICSGGLGGIRMWIKKYRSIEGAGREARARADSATNRLAIAKSELALVRSTLPILTKITTIREARAKTVGALSEIDQSIGILRCRIEAGEKDIQISRVYREKYPMLRARHDILSAYRTAISSTGYRIEIIRELVESIVATANESMVDICDARVSAEICEKSIDFYVSVDGVKISAELASGYYSFVVGIALRAALGEVARTRARFLIVDEGFGYMDAENRERMARGLHGMCAHYEFIVAISHVEEIQRIMDHRIVIDRVHDAGIGARCSRICVGKMDLPQAETGKFMCECGSMVWRRRLAEHGETARHRAWVKRTQKLKQR